MTYLERDGVFILANDAHVPLIALPQKLIIVLNSQSALRVLQHARARS